MGKQSLDQLFYYLVREGDGEPLAQYLETGGDLSGLDAEQRLRLARLVRGKSVRKQGESTLGSTKERDWQICLEVTRLLSYGLPEYTDSGAVNHKESLAEDACSVVAKRYNLSDSRVRQIWDARPKDDPVLAWAERTYKSQGKNRNTRNEGDLPDYSAWDEMKEAIAEAWKEPKK